LGKTKLRNYKALTSNTKNMSELSIKIPTMADMLASGEEPEILFWVGCMGSYDERAQRVTQAFAKILTHTKIKFAVLGTEESCTGDPAKRAGNEFKCKP
jgi:heterodisulfide reductase subunit D